jgi:hypothetical protein
MRKYLDAQGNTVGTSKGCQGGCMQLIAGLFLLCLVIGLISSIH